MERITTARLAQAFIDEQVKAVQEQVGDKKVLLALSGGVDSSVVAALLIRAIGQQLVCVHVNHGLLRKGEPEQVIRVFRDQMNANLVYVDAADRFLGLLEGVTDPETKRKIIGIVMIILSIVPMIIVDCNLTVALFFVLVGAGVFLLVYNGARKDLFKQIRKAQARARARVIRRMSGRRYVSTPKTKKEKYHYSDRNLSTLMPIYWEVVTCFYFAFSFMTGTWPISWLIWIAAGAVKKVIENKYGEPTGA